MAKRKYIHHGSKRKKKKKISLSGTSCQTESFSFHEADLISIATDPCCATALTLNLGDLYDGARLLIDFDSNVACDTLTLTASCCQTLLASGSFNDNARMLIEVTVFDSTKDAEVISVVYNTIA